MPGASVHVDDEVLFRVITGAATETEREAVALWLQASGSNLSRFQELTAVLEALNRDEQSMPVPQPPAVSGIIARARLNGGPGGAVRRRPIIGPVALGLAATILAIGVFLDLRSAPIETPAPFGGEQHRTAQQQSASFVLLDGTRVELGPQSSIATQLDGDAREVMLTGRASFQVAHQGSRSFVVRTPVGEIRDIGTQFTVREDSGSTRVAVFEGRVGFSNAQGSAEAGAGELIATRASGSPVVSRIGASHSASDWVRAELVFEGTTIDEVARVIEQRYRVPVHVTDPAVGRRTVSAWFVRDPGLEEVFDAVCRAVDATCGVEGSARVISQAS